jgi:spore coat protein CotH
VINEAAPDPETGEDWFELLAVGEGTVSVSDYTVVDTAADRVPAVLPSLTLSAGEFLVVTASDTDPADGSAWVPFKLGAEDGLTLSAACDAADCEPVTDAMTWSALPAGATWGRLPDGTGDAVTTSPTPGAANTAWEGSTVPSDGTLFDPTRVVTVKLTFSEADWQATVADPKAEQYYPATLEFDGTVVENVAARTKGNSSLNAVSNPNDTRHRYPFKVDINYYAPDQTLRGRKKFVLNNGMKDPSMLREHLAYGLMRDFNMIAPRTGFADVWVNTEHLGVYTIVEAVDGDFIEEHFVDDSGDLYKPDSGGLMYLGDDLSVYSSMGLETNEGVSDGSTYVALCKGISEGNLANVLNVDQALRYLAVNTILVNLDSYLGTGHNFYLYEDNGIFALLPWDTNEAFGNFTCGCDREGVLNFRIDEPTCGSMPQKALAQAVINDPDLTATYHSLLSEFIGGLFSASSMESRITTAADVIRPFVELDTTKFYSMAQFEAGLDQGSTSTSSSGGMGASAIGLMAFVTARSGSVQSQLDGTLASTSTGEGSCMASNVGPPPPPP